ncbi:hypothetical protein ACFU7Y_29095, partial [Kitasatospora sp. NPDC057542]
MKSSHNRAVPSAAFDEPNLIADAGLVPLVRLAERVGLPGLVGERLQIGGAGNSAGANPAAKAMTLVAAMCAGADSIDDTGRLRYGAMGRLFGGVRAPSTLGTFLRAFTHGHNRQLHSVHRDFLARLARDTPLLPGLDQVAFVDIDPTHRRAYGRAKQGAEVGRFKGVRTGGAYLAPLVAARLEAAGVDVQVTSVRPGEHHDTGHRRVLLVDDPPLTGRTLLALARDLPGAEVLVPVFATADVQPLRQAGVAVTMLLRGQWQSTRRLDPDALAAYLEAHAQWPGAHRPPVLDALVPGRENSVLTPWPGVRHRSPARAAVRLRTPDSTRNVIVEWVPPGIFGDAARAAATVLRHPLVPVTFAVAPALVVSEDLTPTVPLGP